MWLLQYAGIRKKNTKLDSAIFRDVSRDITSFLFTIVSNDFKDIKLMERKYILGMAGQL